MISTVDMKYFKWKGNAGMDAKHSPHGNQSSNKQKRLYNDMATV